MSRIQSICSLAFAFISVSAAGWAADSTIFVRVYSEVALPEQVLSHAEGEANRVFQQAKVATIWINCETSSKPTDARCEEAPDEKHLVLRIVPKALSAADSIFGMSFVFGGGGVYSDVFFDSVEVLHRDCGATVARVLGHVMAHEVGHLLLGSNSHSALGIMCPSWHNEQLRRVEMGTLFFTTDQARVMHRKISNLQPPTETSTWAALSR